MRFNVNAVERFTRRQVLVSLVALVVKYVAQLVAVKLDASIAPIRAGLGVMPTCNGCRKERENAGKVCRQLIRLPIEVTTDKVFKRQALAVQLCGYCDGDAVEEAIKAHDSRTSPS